MRMMVVSKPKFGGGARRLGTSSHFLRGGGENGVATRIGTTAIGNELEQQHLQRQLNRNLSSSTTPPTSSSDRNPDGEDAALHVDSPTDLKLYQYAICPFCNITKAIMQYHKIPHEAIEVNPLTKKEIPENDANYRKVPILTASSSTTLQQFNGTDEILDYLLQNQSSTLPRNTGGEKDNDEKWMLYAREELAPLLYPNICNTLPQAFQTMSYVHTLPPSQTNNPQFTTIQKYSIQFIGSLAMYMAASKIKSKCQYR